MVQTIILSGIGLCIACLITMFFMIKNQNLIIEEFKVNESNKQILESLDGKQDLCDRLINIIDRQLKLDNKIFKDVKKITKKNTSYEKDKVLTEAEEQILTIKEDYNKLNSVKTFNELIKDLNETETKLISLRTYYNKHVLVLNNMISKFPYNLLAKRKKIVFQKIYEGKELNENEKVNFII